MSFKTIKYDLCTRFAFPQAMHEPLTLPAGLMLLPFPTPVLRFNHVFVANTIRRGLRGFLRLHPKNCLLGYS
ncbi:hypothetical protein ABIA69_003559 [Lysinibacillus parviboronicapiens]|uniref:Uncharacterized protein n=1 Tax=Lysinibacillus parviboronicapiens TaxID=436516 RepID=A0ABV2PP79_9BACI